MNKTILVTYTLVSIFIYLLVSFVASDLLWWELLYDGSNDKFNRISLLYLALIINPMLTYGIIAIQTFRGK